MISRIQTALFLLALSSAVLNAQHELSGYILNASNGFPVSEASIQLKDHGGFFCQTDSAGHFVLKTPVSEGTLLIRHLSYESHSFSFSHETVLPFYIRLTPSEKKIAELVIKATRDEARNNELRKISFRKEAISEMTSGFGEADVIRSLQSMPGIHKSSEVNAALNVRGTGHGSNRITLDGQELYNSYHLLGIVPMFNPDILESVELQKSGFNAKNGNALSSFLNIESLQPDLQEPSYSIAVSSLSAKALYEGPLLKDNISVLAASRYSYFDLVSGIYKLLHNGKEGYSPLPEYRLYEGFLKLHFRLKKDWKADLTVFQTGDNFIFSKEGLDLRTRWRNQLYSINLSKTLSPGSRIKVHTGISRYKFSGKYNPYWNILRQNDLLSWDTQVDYQGRTATGWNWYAGAFGSMRYFEVNSEESYASQVLTKTESEARSLFSGAYGHLRIPLSETIQTEGGLRLVHYFHENHLIRLAPRFQLNVRSGDFAMNLSYDRTHQFSHLISPLGFNIPADLWVPAGADSPIQSCNQYSLNMHYIFGILRTSMGIFFKDMNGLSDLRTGSDLLAFHPASALVFGKGTSSGIETAWHFRFNTIKAEIYYTYARSRRVFEEINQGLPFQAPCDIPHQVDVNLHGDLLSAWDWNISWFLASGQVTTMPTGYVFLSHGEPSLPYPLYTSRYNFRMPASHRMDISLQYHRSYPGWKSVLTMGIYNAYHRSNPYFLYFTIDELPEGNLGVTPRQLSIFPFTPFISLKIQWI